MLEPIEDDDTEDEQTENSEDTSDTSVVKGPPRVQIQEMEIEADSDEIEADSDEIEADSDEIEADTGASTAAKVGGGIGGILFLVWLFAGVDTESNSDELGVL